MEKFFSRLSEKKFKIISTIFLFLGDISICTYLWFRFTDKETFNSSISLITQQMKSQGGLQIAPNFAREVYQIMVQSLIFALSIFACYHLLVYLMFHFKKRFAYGYLKIMLIFAIPGSLLMGLTGFAGDFPMLWFLIQSLLFAFVFIGITKFFPLKINKGEF